MKIILLDDVKKQGKKGEIIEVADGYGNFLIKSKKAVLASSAGVNRLNREKADEKKALEELIKECNKIKDPKKKAEALIAAEDAFFLWMDVYPETEMWPDRLQIQKKHDEFMDFVGLNPKNPE